MLASDFPKREASVTSFYWYEFFLTIQIRCWQKKVDIANSVTGLHKPFDEAPCRPTSLSPTDRPKALANPAEGQNFRDVSGLFLESIHDRFDKSSPNFIS